MTYSPRHRRSWAALLGPPGPAGAGEGDAFAAMTAATAFGGCARPASGRRPSARRSTRSGDPQAQLEEAQIDEIVRPEHPLEEEGVRRVGRRASRLSRFST